MIGSASTPAAAGPRRSLGRIYYLEAKTELLKHWRLPAFSVPTVLFPVIFYWFFGLAFAGGQTVGAVSFSAYLLATYGTFGVLGTALFGFGAGVATERGLGWLSFKRATPMPPLAYFVGKFVMCVAFSALIIALLSALAGIFGGVRLEAMRWLQLMLTLVLGSIPFCAAGLVIGFAVGPNAAPTITNLIYLPTAFLSGLWIPVEALPSFFQKVAPWLPPYHLARLALSAVGLSGTTSTLTQIAVLVAFGAAALGLALVLQRRDAPN